MYEDVGEKQSARIEAFSDGVFAIALTLLAIDLKAPVLAAVSSANLFAALAERWPEYLAFINSFVTVLLLWTSHHDIFKKVYRTDRRLTLANGLVLFFVSAVPYPTSVLGKYLLTDAAPAAAAFYAAYCVLINTAFIVLWWFASAQNSKLLREGVSRADVQKTLRGLAMPLPIYVLAVMLAFVSPWISVVIITALWIYWAATLKNETDQKSLPD